MQAQKSPLDLATWGFGGLDQNRFIGNVNMHKSNVVVSGESSESVRCKDINYIVYMSDKYHGEI